MNTGTFTFKLLEIKQPDLISVKFLDPRTTRESPKVDVVLWGEAKQKLSQIQDQNYLLVRGFLSQRNNTVDKLNNKIHIHALTLDFL